MAAPISSDDAGFFELVRKELFTSVVGDVMDVMGLTSSSFLRGSGPSRTPRSWSVAR